MNGKNLWSKEKKEAKMTQEAIKQHAQATINQYQSKTTNRLSRIKIGIFDKEKEDMLFNASNVINMPIKFMEFLRLQKLHGLLLLLNIMIIGVESGKSFTDTLDDFNIGPDGSRQRVDVIKDNDGTLKLGPRITGLSPQYEYWLAAAYKRENPLTDKEKIHFSTTQNPDIKYNYMQRISGMDIKLSPQIISFFVDLAPSIRTNILNEIINEVGKSSSMIGGFRYKLSYKKRHTSRKNKKSGI